MTTGKRRQRHQEEAQQRIELLRHKVIGHGTVWRFATFKARGIISADWALSFHYLLSPADV